MTRQVQILTPDSTMGEAATIMATNDLGMIPVIENNHLAGVVTDRDLVVRGLAMGGDRSLPVRDVMTPDVATLPETKSVEEAADLMETKQIRRIVVVGSEEEVTGVVSLGDLVCKGTGPERSGRVLEKVCNRSKA
jgi:CBS domain-containing protein